MEIISWKFTVFVVIVLAVYYLLSRRAQNVWLLIASCVFYSTLGWNPVFILTLVTLLNFIIAIRIDKSEMEPERRLLLWLGLVIDAGSLVVFRLFTSGYAGRLLDLLVRVTHSPSDFFIEIILPTGFSFYILQAISYLIDVFRRQISASRDPVDFALYMAYFPRLVSGPIERARDFLPKLSSSRSVDNLAFRSGFTLILTGLVRKLLFADILSRSIPEDLFFTPNRFASIELVFYLILYSFWLYNDFAGYTGIVRGVSCFFGIDLSPNFSQPYFALNFVDFWNRWHITLSHWLRDYIYLPLSRILLRRNRSRSKLVNIFIPPLATMLASGLWHNLGVYMLAWGGMHSIYQALERMSAAWLPHPETSRFPGLRRLLATLLVFVLTCLAWVAFASGSFTRAVAYWLSMVSSTASPSLSFTSFFLPALVILVCLILDWFQYRSDDELVFLQ